MNKRALININHKLNNYLSFLSFMAIFFMIHTECFGADSGILDGHPQASPPDGEGERIRDPVSEHVYFVKGGFKHLITTDSACRNLFGDYGPGDVEYWNALGKKFLSLPDGQPFDDDSKLYRDNQTGSIYLGLGGHYHYIQGFYKYGFRARDGWFALEGNDFKGRIADDFKSNFQ